MSTDEEKKFNVVDTVRSISEDDASSSADTDMYELEGNDAILAKKMKLINDAIDEIGFTPYHLKLFFLNGMGYATDSQLSQIESSVRTYVNYQFGWTYPISNEMLAIGLLVGALFWGFSADLIGRRTAFNFSLFLSAVLTIMNGAMSSMATYCIFMVLSMWACGGNLVLDTCVFLEYLPHKDQWLLTFFAFFWSIGQTVAVLLAYAFLPNNSCSSAENCPSHENRGWRYVFYTNGAIVLVLAILRVTVIRLQETPKFLVSNNRDAEAVEVLQSIAKKYNRNCSLTLDQLAQYGEIESNDDYRKDTSLAGIYTLVKHHVQILFSARKVARSTALVYSSWSLLGIAYPLYSSFLPVYLATRGHNISADTTAGVYRDNVVGNISSMGGPIIAGLLLYFFPKLGRRGVLFIGGIVGMALLFGYTAIKNHTQNVALSSASYAGMYIYYACLYAYTPEVFPAVARATGNAIAIACTRVAACIVPVIAYYSNTSSSVPIWICGSFIGIIGVLALFLPFEPSKQRVV
ncbi:major facilitator superfamily domain-containing protein [Scheffersomyces coipomensis]|uniref:major facilitator superfamily domain-containing protein n=1 Tax=Scheffersomyces coipomensis TaxID=1788519 RepID=UPI00315DDC36